VRGINQILLGQPGVTLLRGRRDGLEVTLSQRDLEEAFDELQARLAEQPTFYYGSSAVANFGALQPSSEAIARLRSLLDVAGISLRAISGSVEGLDALASEHGLTFERTAEGTAAREELPRPRPLWPRTEVRLSESARSLVADFSGARSDIAQRRSRGEGSVPRLKTELKSPAPVAPGLHVVEALPTTLYHAATLRGGQMLQHSGNIVIVGDVNPGAEVVATGDIVIFGRLAGIAHAGAGGNEQSRIYALDLAATQVRIATFIAADHDAKRRAAPRAEVALVQQERIRILPLDWLYEVERAGTSP
jgi:septum site-determining protein MinC